MAKVRLLVLLTYIVFIALIAGCAAGCASYFDYNYYNRVVITKQATMTYILFQPTQTSSLDISATDTLHFLNQTSEPALICISEGGGCMLFKDNVDGPRELYAPGRKIQPEQIVDVTFENEGRYVLTISTLPHTHLTVNVKQLSTSPCC
jgi:hypothetical protein